MGEPRATAPQIHEGYGVPADGSGGERLPWAWAVERLGASRNYWVCSTCPDGRPHAAPVWGLWLDDAMWFSTARRSWKGRNLTSNPSVVVHLESGDETVILRGEVEEVNDPAALASFLDAYDAKYDLRPDPGSQDAFVFVLRPTVALTWEERDYPNTATRWIFGRAVP